MFGFFKKKPKTMLEDLGICAENIANAAKADDPLLGAIGISAQISGAIQGARDAYGLELADGSVLSIYFAALSRQDFDQKHEMERKIAAKIDAQNSLEAKGRLMAYLITGKQGA